jgi:hypothetical protein
MIGRGSVFKSLGITVRPLATSMASTRAVASTRPPATAYSSYHRKWAKALLILPTSKLLILGRSLEITFTISSARKRKAQALLIEMRQKI